MIVTRQLLRAWNACYKDQQIAELVPEAGLTPIQLVDLDIPNVDRIWGACQVLARDDRKALITLARKWAASADAYAAASARWAAAAAASRWAAAARWAADARWAAAAAAAASRWDAAAAAADAAARKQQVLDCREALLQLETKQCQPQ